MAFVQNVAFIDNINTCVTAMMADGKIDKNDIPALMLLICDLITTSSSETKTQITTEQMVESINSLYNYIMSHYNLFPTDEIQKAQFKAMFDMCVKLALFQPRINKECKSIFSCMCKQQ